MAYSADGGRLAMFYNFVTKVSQAGGVATMVSAIGGGEPK